MCVPGCLLCVCIVLVLVQYSTGRDAGYIRGHANGIGTIPTDTVYPAAAAAAPRRPGWLAPRVKMPYEYEYEYRTV